MILERLESRLQAALDQWCREKGVETTPLPGLSAAPSHVQADVSTGWPLQTAKKVRKAPLQVAGELAEAVRGALSGLASTDSAAPGFLNLKLTDEALLDNLRAVLESPSTYGRLETPPAAKTQIEFVSANPTGPLHLGHGRGAALGDALVRILRRLGTKVEAEFYVNDAGGQIEKLGLSLQARYKQKKGEAAEVPEGGYQGDYMKALAETLPPEADQWTPAQFADFTVERMMAEQKQDLEAFRVSFDHWYRERDLHRSDAIPKVVAKLKASGMAYEKEGALWFGSAGSGEDDKDRVLIRSDGRPTYFLPDIAYHLTKVERGYDVIVDVWGADHHGYVPRMKAAMAALGQPPEGFKAVICQLVHLFRGKEPVKMSKRSGEFVTLKDVIDEVGADASRYFFAMRSPNSHLNFDLELAKKQSQENPVYYVQYVHARIRSIFAEAEKRGFKPGKAQGPLTAPEERALLVKLAWFPETLKSCAKEMSPHHLTTYLAELAGLYHPFYEKCRVVDEANPETTKARLALCEGVRTVIAEGLGLLGVSAPDRM